MLEYIALYPETLAAVRRYPAADRALLYEAMVMYGTEGTEPDWPEEDLKWLIWESLRQRVDQAAKKSDTNRRNRSGTKNNEEQRTTTNNNETERTGTNDNETERTGTNRNHHTETHTQTETKTDADTEPREPRGEDEHTHEVQQEGDAGARARESALWYNPEHPDGVIDTAWLSSDSARKAIGQRILNHVVKRKLISMDVVTAESGRIIGREIGESLNAAMRAGIPPGECQRMAAAARALWAWEIRLKQAALNAGTAPPGMADAWREDVAEMAGDTEELALYG